MSFLQFIRVLSIEMLDRVGSIHKRPARAGFVLLLTLGVGCGTPSGRPLHLPAGHQLSAAAYQVARKSDRLAAVPRELTKIVLPEHIVQPGDVLLVETLDREPFVRVPVDQPVMIDGTIDLGRYGRVVVAGRTVEQIELLVESAVAAVEDKPVRFNVQFVACRSAVCYVLGDVNAPGAMPLTGRETVLDVLLAAGGLSDRGSRCDIVLSRPSGPEECRTVLPVCYDHIVQLGDTTTNYQVMPGDRVFVASRTCCQDLLPRFLKRDCALCDCSSTSACGTSAIHTPLVTYTRIDGVEPQVPVELPAPLPEPVESIPPAPLTP